MARDRYKESVFLNVPFDDDYKPLFEAMVFSVFDCGFVARSALEISDSIARRIDRICDLIAACKYGIHDISRTELDKQHRLPRFNMPLELGIFLGAQRFGSSKHRSKRALILDRKRYRYQEFCSDIAGQDIGAHAKQVKRVIRCIRDWLRGQPEVQQIMLPGSDHMHRRYGRFRRELPKLCRELKLDLEDLTFNDYIQLVSAWLQENPR